MKWQATFRTWSGDFYCPLRQSRPWHRDGTSQAKEMVSRASGDKYLCSSPKPTFRAVSEGRGSGLSSDTPTCIQ